MVNAVQKTKLKYSYVTFGRLHQFYFVKNCMVPQTSAPVVITERGQRLVYIALFKVVCPNSPHTSCSRMSFGKAVAALQSG